MGNNSGLLAPPTKSERQEAASVIREMQPISAGGTKHAWLLLDNGKKVEVPTKIIELLILGLRAFEKGQGLRAIPVTRSVTTQQAADIMGCSRQHVVNLIDQNNLKATKVGSHRRIDFEELLAFMNTEDQRREQNHLKMMEEISMIDGYKT